MNKKNNGNSCNHLFTLPTPSPSNAFSNSQIQNPCQCSKNIHWKAFPEKHFFFNLQCENAFRWLNDQRHATGNTPLGYMSREEIIKWENSSPTGINIALPLWFKTNQIGISFLLSINILISISSTPFSVRSLLFKPLSFLFFNLVSLQMILEAILHTLSKMLCFNKGSLSFYLFLH